MAHSSEVRARVRRAYVFERQSLELASAGAGVAYATAARWKQRAFDEGDDWDKLRAASILAGGGMEDVARAALTGFMVQYDSVIKALNESKDITAEDKVNMLSSLADAFNKTISASKRVLPETSELATAMDVLQRLAEFVRTRFPKHAAAFQELLEPFGEELAKHYG